MCSTLDIPLHGPSVNIVRRCGAALGDVLQSKFGCVATFEGASGLAQPGVPERRFAVLLPAGVRVSVWKADLTHFPVQAVVNAANRRLEHFGGVALALSTAGGPQIQKESDEYIKKYSELQVGDALVMDSGSLPCNKMIHAVGPQLPKCPSNKELSKAEVLLRKTIGSVLDRVQETRLQTVAIPAVSSGLYNYPVAQCAIAIATAVKRYYERPLGHRPTEVMLVNHDEPTVREMEKACRQILDPHAAAGKGKGSGKTSAPAVRIRNVRLWLNRGHIEDQQTDVIVNTTFNRDLNSGQISKALLRKAGPELQKEMRTAPMQGNVIVTNAYGLQCKEVYHTLCYEKEKEKKQEVIFRSVRECLNLAVLSHHKSIAFPAIGAGGLHLEGQEVARIMSRVVPQFARTFPDKMDVYFVIFPRDHKIFEAFEEQLRDLSHHSSDLREGGASAPQISLSGPSEEATAEAERWLRGRLFESSAVFIRNNFILHFGQREHLRLSRLMKGGLYVTEVFERGRASVVVDGDSNEDVAVAGLRVEAVLCDVQREFVGERERALKLTSGNAVLFERKPVEQLSREFSDRIPAFGRAGLHVVKVDRVENPTLRMLFELKKQQLLSSNSRKMFQRIPAQFCDMVGHIGFHAEYAPPDDPAFGEGIYFAGTVKMAMKLWKEPHWDYLHFVEAEVLTGISAPGEPGLILPPAVGSDPQIMVDSVSGGPEIAVIFCGYQALPRYIITCKIRKV
ncbi:protein mono-ADP-ribosyltransferase PARP9 [Brachionichthys hirsutus]|uniref:protein mono-ADP-ribosyltransferase PARP9 n=1 Tax=Brachionichthys hirsutus TaxID=412623 RepID=UPI003604455C